MKRVNFAELKDNLEQLFDSAHVERIHITEDGEDKVVMLPYVVFEQMRQEFKPQAMHVSELPEEAIRAVLKGLRSKADEEPDQDSGS